MNEVANMADSLDFSYSYSCRNTATLPSPILSVDIYKSTVIIYGPYRSRSRSRSRALINFSTHTHTRDGMYRMSRLWPARVSSAHQLGHLISASGPSSKLNWDIYNMQSSAVKNEMLQKIQMEIGMINSGRHPGRCGYDGARDCKSGSQSSARLRSQTPASSRGEGSQDEPPQVASRWVGCCLFNGILAPAQTVTQHK